jgi:hypothetical protein
VLAVLAHDVPITLGALGAWTAFEPDLLIALVAANLDFRRNFEAPVRDRPPGRDRDNRGDRRGSFPPFLFGPFLFFFVKSERQRNYIYIWNKQKNTWINE